uniref:Dihydroorotase, mitochondrial n=1 Tax=Fibrocapsa japonica TaxID=94617 RepID=A0A7S2USN6_9STRA
MFFSSFQAFIGISHSVPRLLLPPVNLCFPYYSVQSPARSFHTTIFEMEPAGKKGKVDQFEIVAPDDWHHHLRDGDVLKETVFHASKSFKRIIVMPNLKPPVTTTEEAASYCERILAVVPEDKKESFQPLMTLYMTDRTSAEEIRKAKESGLVYAVKLYPAGATTNSDSGVTDIQNVYPALEAMADVGMPLLVHGEVTDQNVDVFDREPAYIERVLKGVVEKFPALKVVMEHITTAEAAEWVQAQGPNVGATITAHHLLYNRNAIFKGGICPHMFCLPILKRERHRQALLQAATSGNPKFFLGTDSAPHAVQNKISPCGCAGIFTGHAPMSLYAEAFDSVSAMDKLEGFSSFHGPDFYGLPRNSVKITLVRNPWTVPNVYSFGKDEVVPLKAGMDLEWTVS